MTVVGGVVGVGVVVSDCDNTDNGDYGIIYLNHQIMAVPAAAGGDDDGDGDAVVAAATVNNDDDYKKYNDLFRLQYLRFSCFTYMLIRFLS